MKKDYFQDEARYAEWALAHGYRTLTFDEPNGRKSTAWLLKDFVDFCGEDNIRQTSGPDKTKNLGDLVDAFLEHAGYPPKYKWYLCGPYRIALDEEVTAC
jgi:hypothetical protein